MKADLPDLQPQMESTAAGLYVHVPFCSEVCPYCDFAVLEGSATQRRAFADLVGLEIDLIADDGWRFDTVYIGGGTPSALEPEVLSELLARLRRDLVLVPEAQLALEANPEDVDARSCAQWRQLGVSRLSLGVQAFDDQALRYLGRRHDTEQARRAAETALAAGFDWVSLDLIYGFPDDALHCEEGFWRSLEVAVDLAPQHLSCFQLTVHRDTAFGRRRQRGELREMDDRCQARSFLRLHDELGRAGYEAYEVSSFARRRCDRSKHNQKYWRHVPYLGLGPSAHSFSGRARWWNERGLAAYARRLRDGERPLAEHEVLAAAELALESLMLGLRTSDGVDAADFERRFGARLLDRNAALIERLIGEGRLQLEGEILRPTTLGMAIADGLAASFEIGL